MISISKFYKTCSCLIGLSLTLLPIQSQNCFNSDFESGDLSGYSAYIGQIKNDGSIVITTPSGISNQHEVLSVFDGYDDIAYVHCVDNKLLPVVPPGGGSFAMRLGNSMSGAKAEKVNIQFTVTDQTSFFLLRYAVILNDPGHLDHEQPRFRLSITDKDGQEYPCGRYEVVAAPELKDFENCDDDWKVRPWTTVGVELLSYLGEEINIELITTDCALGGHAGYAYLDASCQPLEIELFNNCTDTSYAQMQVTPGFEIYNWSTGDTTSTINIQSPVVGDIYHVTVTSATGCELVMSDTIPSYDIISAPVFDPVTDFVSCMDTSFWFRPPGENLQKIYSQLHQGFVDSVLVNNIYNGGYTFIAYSDFGCAYDTVTYYFRGLPEVSDSIISVNCYRSNEGGIYLSTLNPDIVYNYNWSTGASTDYIENVSPGDYQVTITAPWGCQSVKQYTILSPPILEIQVSQDQINCQDSVGTISVYAIGGSPPVRYSSDGGLNYSFMNTHSFTTIGLHTIIAKDVNSCTDTLEIFFEASPLLSMGNVEILREDPCSLNRVTLSIHNVVGGSPPYTYILNDNLIQSENTFPDLPVGEYFIKVIDDNECIVEKQVSVPELDNFKISDVLIHQTSCGQDNAQLTIITNSNDGITYALNELPFSINNNFPNLSAGEYLARARDLNECIDSFQVVIENSQAPIIESVNIDYTSCIDGNNLITIAGDKGVKPYSYKLNNAQEQNSNEFKDLPVGEYYISLLDAMLCEAEAVFKIEELDPLNYELINIVQPKCGFYDGIIEISVAGGIGDTYIELENDYYPDDYIFSNLKDGRYQFKIKDDSHCSYDVQVDLLAECDVYVPNIFTPNQDGIHEWFKPYIDNDVEGNIVYFNIYDHWGERIFSADNISVHDRHCGWDGRFKQNLVSPGLYAYDMKIEFYNGYQTQRTGQVTVIR